MIALSSPLLIGIYQNDRLIEKYEEFGKTSDMLPILFSKILDNYDIKNIFFANGPGSFMAIKVAYIFLKTLSTSLNINIFAADGFCFNNNSPIKAMKKVYFIKEDKEIITSVIDDEIDNKLELPEVLKKDLFSTNCDPLYVLPAV
ncbi:MAG: hypothetical protein R3331_09730 [Sulfurospirillaceae bacterium]|nr:hypothetical protein [Sulfurospirillaceae bacterium]